MITSLAAPSDRVHTLIEQNHPELDRTVTHGFINMRLSQLIHEPDFKLKGIRPVTRENRELASVDFEYSSKVPRKSDKEMLECSMVLRPDDSWTVQEVRVKGPGANQSVTACEYGESVDGLPTLRHYRTELQFVDAKGIKGSFWQDDVFDRYAYRTPPPSAFTLSAFGLPEINGDPGAIPRPRLELWLLGIGIFLAVVAVVFWFRKGWWSSGGIPA